ncbi:hypothetical protein BKA62DRAFT_220435 [Auriculariales sp. MPI-PUGE-AT-0066]|nr:hypothetical protein BKA62DRAFT_220435 [Auriculariales sp. MPI-PUGE-AT-0066]
MSSQHPPRRVQKKPRAPFLSEGVILSCLLLIAAATVPLVFRSATHQPTDTTAAPSVTPIPSSSSELAPGASRPAPIIQVLLAITPIAAAIARILLYALAILAAPFAAAFRGLLAIFHPFVLVINATFYVFVQLPWQFAAAVGRIIYPIYTFAMVALLLGATGGLLALGVGRLSTLAASKPKPKPQDIQGRRKKLA